MSSDNVPLLAMNRGIISPLALARVDIKRTAMSAEIQTNWMPRVLGSAMLRPGLQFIGETKNDSLAVHIPFVFSTNDYAILEFTDQLMRIRINDQIIARGTVSTTVVSGDFSSATGWTDDDEAGGVSTISGGLLSLVGNGFAAAIRDQAVTVSGTDVNKEHALRVIVTKGVVTFSVGTAAGDDTYVTRTTLGVGVHSLAFTPTGTFYIRFSSTTQSSVQVDSCQIEAAGNVEIPAPWKQADLQYLRYDQSADVVYVTCFGTYQQRKIERRGTGRSWSIVLYQPVDGPFQIQNVTTTTLTPSALTGDITLTANRALFKTTSVGTLYRITSTGQEVDAAFTSDNQFSNAIRITGVGAAQRAFAHNITGTWAGTVTLQRSVDNVAWVDVSNYTANEATTAYNDGLDNQILYYRFGIKTGAYTSGEADIQMIYTKSGGITGIVRVTAYTDSTHVSAEVLTALGATSGSSNWSEGTWSDRRGWPSAVLLFQGRLWFGGTGKIIGSVSDAYESFDDTVIGDAGPINRTIGSGPVDVINWLARIRRLIIGTDGAEWTAQSSSLDEPLTPSNFGLDDPSTQGSANVAAVKLDSRILFVQKSGIKLYQLENAESSDVYGTYQSTNLNELTPEVGRPGMTRLAAQRQPDTRVHCVRSDGVVAVLVSQPAEDVLCWILVETNGRVEDVFVLPGIEEDQVYYVVNRNIAGVQKRFLEKWALEIECQGNAMTKLADCFITYQGAPTTNITGLGHLEGMQVVAWGDGQDLAGPDRNNPITFTVTGGAITLPIACANVCVGLYYEARFKSAKLAFAAQMGTALTMRKRVCDVGLILANTHYQGLRYGPTFDADYNGASLLDDLPLIEDGALTPQDLVWEALDTNKIALNGEWNTDSRVCFTAAAPRPCTILAAVVGMTTNG